MAKLDSFISKIRTKARLDRNESSIIDHLLDMKMRELLREWLEEEFKGDTKEATISLLRRLDEHTGRLKT